MAMPALPEEAVPGSLHEIVKADRDWIPGRPEGSLYLRPFMFASEVFLGVRPATEYLYSVIASPVGPYFARGVQPVAVWASETYTRAAPGGTGAAKCGGNYAAGLSAQAEAMEHGCDQVIYLDAGGAPLRRRTRRHERVPRSSTTAASARRRSPGRSCPASPATP
jgi:branched-chain amino acid aminotransferase